jgi:hypothetical protein
MLLSRLTTWSSAEQSVVDSVARYFRDTVQQPIPLETMRASEEKQAARVPQVRRAWLRRALLPLCRYGSAASYPPNCLQGVTLPDEV